MKKLYNIFGLLVLFSIVAQPLFLASQSNQYIHLDKEDDFIILEEAGQYVTNGDGLTIAGWFLCDELSYGQGYMGFRGGSSEMYLIQLSDGKMECRLIMPEGFYEVAPSNVAVPLIWQHWAWTWDGVNVTLYVDGVEKGSVPAEGTFEDEDVSFGIGKSLLGGYNFIYGGGIDEVSVWNKGLTQTEIQDMMGEELTGDEEGLQLYYKVNQGDPGGNNATITHLISEIGSPERDAELMNFALDGETSNFIGTVDVGYQAISWAQLPNHLTTDAPFTLEAEATSGLTVMYEVLSGPATVDGSTLTLTGQAGEVIVEATQPGDDTYDPAEAIQNAFMVINPAVHVPDIDVRNPLAGDVYVPNLDYIQLAALITVDYPELFDISAVSFIIGDQNAQATNWGDGYYTAWWAPPAYGTYTINIFANTNYGASGWQTVTINVVEEAMAMEVLAVDSVWLNTTNVTEVVTAELPSYLGAFDQITATLEVTCPPGGCGAWDRVASVDARGHDGKWLEIFRYITPYGTACSHTIDLTDYMSILQGKVDFRINCYTLDNGYYYKLTFNYEEGTPMYNYSFIDVVWWETYQFGDYANLQPVEDWSYTFADNALASTLKLVSSGHGWGDLNTGNAAEFHEDTHHLHVNGAQTFEQHNWAVCNPNPDDCSPQNGTWFYNRAGWCPGAIAPWFDYDMTEFIDEGDVTLGYEFNPDYMDYCHPNHPDCETGVTCDDCSAGFNPHLIVACNLVTFSDSPVDEGNVVGVNNTGVNSHVEVTLFPNPTNGIIELNSLGKRVNDEFSVTILDVTGTTIDRFEWNGDAKTLDLSNYPAGLYFFDVRINERKEMFKVVLN